MWWTRLEDLGLELSEGLVFSLEESIEELDER